MKTTMKRPWFPSLGLMASMVIVLVMVQSSKAIGMMSSGNGQVAYAEQTIAQNLTAPDDVGWTINNSQMEKINTVNMVMVNRLTDHSMAGGEHFAQTLVYDDHPSYANIDHCYLCPVNKDLNVDVVTAERGLYQVDYNSWNINGLSAPNYYFQLNYNLNSPADARTDHHLLLPQPTRLVPVYPRE